MKSTPTYDDAQLILKLYDLRREETLRTARKWMGAAPQFTSRQNWLTLCPPGSDENAYYRMVVTYWDMASSFVVNGVLNAELFYKSNNIELLFVWEKIRILVPELREVQKNTTVARNLEQVATGFIEYMNETSPGWYEQHQKNVTSIPQPK